MNRRTERPLQLVAGTLSAAIAAIGALWLFAPPLNTFAASYGSPSLVASLFGPAAVASCALVAGVAGVVLALAARAASVRPGLGAALATGVALLVGITFGSFTTIAVLGYVFGAVTVVAGVVTLVVLVRRAPRIGFVLLGVLALIVVAAALLGVRPSNIGLFATQLGGALLDRAGEVGAGAVALLAVAAWVVTAVMSFRGSGAGTAFEAWLVRHRRVLTILAAAGPLPYAVARATWLTPWPLFAPSSAELDSMPGARMTGLVLGCGAVAASILTLGLILPWGRIFPRWMPGLGGRDVPIAAATVPGLVAALVLCVSAAPMIVSTLGVSDMGEGLLIDLVLPLWFWGPMLALAVWAYTAWRLATDRAAAPVAPGTAPARVEGARR